MKPRAVFLAESVLCIAATLGTANAAAEAPDSSGETRPPGGGRNEAAVSEATTKVDTLPPTAVNTEPAPATSPAPAVPRESVARGVPTAAQGRARLSSLAAGPRYRDAHADRLLLAPTAETSPQGSFYATSYEIVLLQLGYALTDDTQLSVTATPPLGEAGVLPADISLKTVLLREPHVSVAALGSATGLLGIEEFNGFLGRAGGVATFCVDLAACRLSFSTSANVALIGPASLLFGGAGMSYRAGRIVSLIAELDTVLPLGTEIGEANGLLGGIGVRLSGPAWGVDLGLLKGGKARSQPSPVVPFLAVTYRYVP